MHQNEWGLGASNIADTTKLVASKTRLGAKYPTYAPKYRMFSMGTGHINVIRCVGRHETNPRAAHWLTEAQKMPDSVQILIVDDSDVTRRIVSTIVRSRHWTVCGEAEDGWSAIRKFQELKPDVVLLDLAMPDLNGIEVARMMSGLDPTVPIILLTVMDMEGLANAARRAGISAVVSKAQCWNLLKSIETAVSQTHRLIQ